MYGNKVFILNALSENSQNTVGVNCEKHTPARPHTIRVSELKSRVLMVKKGQDIFILKFQESLPTGQAKSADFLGLGLWNFKTKFFTSAFVKKVHL